MPRAEHESPTIHRTRGFLNGKKQRAPGTLSFIRIQNHCERLRIRRDNWKEYVLTQYVWRRSNSLKEGMKGGSDLSS